MTEASPLGRIALARGAELYVPRTYEDGTLHPLVVALHGANRGAEAGLAELLPFADDAALLLVAPKSSRETWDLVYGTFGPDVGVIDGLLDDVFRRYAIDSRRIFVSGFSDGASYALSLGLTNGDLFAGIIAFSPGFMRPLASCGRPRLFVSHGTEDQVIPVRATSRGIVPTLRKAGYDVTYRGFAGPHLVPPAIARDAVDWLAGVSRATSVG